MSQYLKFLRYARNILQWTKSTLQGKVCNSYTIVCLPVRKIILSQKKNSAIIFTFRQTNHDITIALYLPMKYATKRCRNCCLQQWLKSDFNKSSNLSFRQLYPHFILSKIYQTNREDEHNINAKSYVCVRACMRVYMCVFVGAGVWGKK